MPVATAITFAVVFFDAFGVAILSPGHFTGETARADARAFVRFTLFTGPRAGFHPVFGSVKSGRVLPLDEARSLVASHNKDREDRISRLPKG